MLRLEHRLTTTYVKTSRLQCTVLSPNVRRRPAIVIRKNNLDVPVHNGDEAEGEYDP